MPEEQVKFLPSTAPKARLDIAVVTGRKETGELGFHVSLRYEAESEPHNFWVGLSDFMVLANTTEDGIKRLLSSPDVSDEIKAWIKDRQWHHALLDRKCTVPTDVIDSDLR